ncbi:MAG: xylulokinase [Atopobiaceae bacterium]|nr:xylulokinase [Atopobiaceae bacterium]
MLYIGVDLGTTATILLLMDEEGEVRRTIAKAYPLYFPQPGWCEQDPIVWWAAVSMGIKELVRGYDTSQIAGIGVAGQMHALVALDENDEPVCPAILWNDNRAQFQSDYLNNEVGRQWLSAQTGNVSYPGFTAPKLLWLREEEPQIFSRINKLMLPKDYINYRLTGKHTTDCSDASGTLLFDVRRRCWSKSMLTICGLRENQMPPVFESYQPIGTLLPDVARELGLPASVVVCAGAGNNAAAAVGTDTVGTGHCNIRITTSGTILVSNDTFMVDEHNALHSFAHADGTYFFMGCMLSASACNRWWMNDILKTRNYNGEQGRINTKRLGHNSVFFLPYLMGERSPYNDPNARGAFIGMHLHTSREDMTQSVLEGVAFAMRDCLDIARAEEIVVKGSTICGTKVTPLWKQIFSNVLGIPLITTKVPDVTSFGAAMLASVACGAWPDVRTCCNTLVDTAELLQPDRWTVSLYEERYDIWRSLYPILKPKFGRMK